MGNEKTFEERYQEELKAVNQEIEAAKTPEAKTAEDKTPEVAEKEVETEQVETPAKNEEEEPKKEPEKTWRELEAEREVKEAERLEFEEFQEWKKDALYQDLRTARKQGIDPKKFFNFLADVDVSLMSDEVLFKNSLKDKNLSESELDEAWEDFKVQKDYIKQSYIDKEKSKIIAQVEEKRKSYKSEAVIPDVNKVYSEAKVELQRFFDHIVGKKHRGVIVTHKMIDDVSKNISKYFASSMKDGKVDVSDAFDTTFAKLAGTEWHEDLIEQGKTKGLEEAHKDRHLPNATSMVSSKKTSEKTQEQKEEEEWRAKYAPEKQSFLTPK